MEQTSQSIYRSSDAEASVLAALRYALAFPERVTSLVLLADVFDALFQCGVAHRMADS